jgi:type IV pilus assembly protein PilC
MQLFKYSARNQNGKVLKGSMEARDRDSVIELLHKKGLIVIKIEEDLGISWERIQEINVGGVPMKDKVLFMRQLATMVGAGLALTKALEILEIQATNPRFKKVLTNVSQSVQGGMTLSESFRKSGDVFDDITLNLIEAGEESGNLELILERLAIEIEEQKKLGDKIRSAMIYPAIILVVIVGVILLMMFVMVPAMSDIYGEFNAELPWVTQLLITMSNALLNYWWLALLIVSVGGIMIKYYLDTPNGKKTLHKTILKIPVLGTIIVKMQLAQFTRVLSLLLRSGLSIVKALELTGNSMSNVVFKKELSEAKKEVEKGTALALPLARSENFPLIVSQMISVGEESGEIDTVLEKLAEYYKQEVDVATNNLSALLEPVMLVVMGGVIAFIALAVYMPMFNLSGVMS